MRYKNVIILFFAIQSVVAQVSISEGVDVSRFPWIEFTVHNRNPDILDSSSFLFTEFLQNQKIKSDSFNIKTLRIVLIFQMKINVY